jgi:hypothetical protein
MENTPKHININACLDYTLGVLLGEDKDAVQRYIAYCEPETQLSNETRVCIIKSGLFDKDYGQRASLPKLPLKEVESVPLLYGTPKIQRENNKLVVHADIIASTYFLVTRYEEMVRCDIRDEHGRFPGRQSLPFRAGFINRPIVEEYAALLRKWLRDSGVNITEPKRRFSVLLTHDVDRLRKYRRPLRCIAAALLGRHPIRTIAECIHVVLGVKKDPYDTFEEMIDLDATFVASKGNIPCASTNLMLCIMFTESILET